jgi:outer membrane protein insertion porin family
VSYDTRTIGTNLRLGFALTEEIAFQPRYTIYRQEITLPTQYNDCIDSSTKPVVPGNSCYGNGEASLAVRKELASGAVLVSLVGYSLAYNTLDNVKIPTSGLYVELKQDFAGVGGDVNFIRTTGEMRTYREIWSDVVGLFKLQGGNISGWGGKDLRMLDHFQMGPNLVRGFAPSGFGPRDLTPNTTNDSLGGTLFWGTTLEAQTPLYFLPKEIGIKASAFIDAGNVWSYEGPTSWSQTGETLQVGLDGVGKIRSAAGIGFLWDSPLGPLRFDFAYPLTKYCETPAGGGTICDKTQFFRFSGGTKF